MRIGDIWETSETDNVDLFETVSHFRVTVGILNGGWKGTDVTEHSVNWNVMFSRADIQHVMHMNRWSMK